MNRNDCLRPIPMLMQPLPNGMVGRALAGLERSVRKSLRLLGFPNRASAATHEQKRLPSTNANANAAVAERYDWTRVSRTGTICAQVASFARFGKPSDYWPLTFAPRRSARRKRVLLASPSVNLACRIWHCVRSFQALSRADRNSPSLVIR